MNVLNSLIDSFRKYPVRWAAAIRSFLLMLTTLGLHLSAEQVVSIMVFTEVALGIPVHNAVTPNVNVPAPVVVQSNEHKEII